MLQKVILCSIERNVSHGVGEDLLRPVNPRTEMSSKWVKSLILQLVFGQQLFTGLRETQAISPRSSEFVLVLSCGRQTPQTDQAVLMPSGSP